MKILVCIKPVPETDGSVRIAPDGKSVQTDPLSPLRMSRYDELALEQALMIRDAFPAARIEVISIGPKRSQTVLKRALGMGANHGMLIRVKAETCLQPSAKAAWIAAAVRGRGYSLILAGMMSEDGMNGQVGPLTAEHLSLPCATAAVSVRFKPEKQTVSIERVPAEGFRDWLELNLPAVLTLQGCGQKPRYPSLSNILRAKEQEIETIGIPAPNLPASLQQTVRYKYPPKTRAGRLLAGSPQQKAQELLTTLREKFFLD